MVEAEEGSGVLSDVNLKNSFKVIYVGIAEFKFFLVKGSDENFK